MKQRRTSILMSRRGLIAGAAGLIMVSGARAALIPTPEQMPGPFYPDIKPADEELLQALR